MSHVSLNSKFKAILFHLPKINKKEKTQHIFVPNPPTTAPPTFAQRHWHKFVDSSHSHQVQEKLQSIWIPTTTVIVGFVLVPYSYIDDYILPRWFNSKISKFWIMIKKVSN